MRRRLKAKTWVDARLESLAQSSPYLQVSYEDFLADNRGITSWWNSWDAMRVSCRNKTSAISPRPAPATRI